MVSKPFRLSGLAVVSLSAALCRAAQPWDLPFTNDTAEVLRAANAVKTPKDAGVVILLDERYYSIDRTGRTTSTTRKVYRVIAEDAVEDWASIEQEYAPWHERRPELRARAISPDGAVHWLDVKTIAEAPARQFEAGIFSDNRLLRAPLPGVRPGAVVEYELTIRETAPALEAGMVRRLAVDRAIETERLHVVVDAAPGIALKKLARLIPAGDIRETQSRKGSHIEVDIGPVAAEEDFESGVPYDVPTGPVFEFSTAPSWQAVAAEYETIVDRQIAKADLGALIPPAPAGEDRMAAVARLVALLHRKARYTGVEFGQAAIVPRTPSEVLTRGYGDCKDKAALLVALLRVSGFSAHVALLMPGAGLDVSPEVPGFGLFSHAIVYLDGPEPLWIDATASSARVGVLPTGDQGRLALIVRAATTGLVKTPESQASDNRTDHTIEIRLSEAGPGTLVETSEATGTFESQIRELYGDPARLKETLERQMKSGYKAESLGAYSATGKDDFSHPFRVSVEALKTPVGYTADDDAVAFLYPGVVFAELPFALRYGAAAPDKEDRKKRREEFVFDTPYRAEFRFRIVPPELFHPKSLPPSSSVRIGSLTYERSFRVLEDGEVEARFRVDSGKRRLTADEFETLRDGLKPLLQQRPESLGFVSAPAEALALGHTGQAIALVVAAANKHPESAGAQARLARVLIAAGDGESAREAGRRAVSLDGKATEAWQALAWADEHDAFGRRFLGGWNREEAEKALRKAVELDKNGYLAQARLAELLERNASGISYGTGAYLAEAVEIYRAIQNRAPNPVAQEELVRALLFAQRLAEAEQEAKKLADSDAREEYLLVVTCLRDGPARAIVDSQSSYPDAGRRAKVLVETSRLVFQMRRYDRAAELAKAAARLDGSSQTKAFADMAGKMRPHEEAVYPPSDPRYPVRRLLVAALSEEPDMEAASKLLSRDARAYADRIVAEIQKRAAGLRKQFSQYGVPLEATLDTLSAGEGLRSEGDDASGYKIDTPFGAGGVSFAGFVVKEAGEYRVLASQDQLAPVGQLVLDLLTAGDLKTAQKWLDRVAALPVEVRVLGPNLGPTHPASIRNLWSGSAEAERGAEMARVSAATLIAQFAGGEAAVGILQEARKTAANRVDRGNMDLALCDAYGLRRQWPEMLATARQLESNYPVAQFAFRYVVQARTALKQWEELEQDAQARLKTAKDDAEALRAAAVAAMVLGDRTGAAAYLKPLMAQDWVDTDTRILIAWNALLGGSVAEAALKGLEDRVGGDQADPGYYYVDGLLQAAAGRAEDAQRSLANALAKDTSAALDPKPWVLLGKIQELYGLPEGAARSYARARGAERADETSDWALALIPREPKPAPAR